MYLNVEERKELLRTIRKIDETATELRITNKYDFEYSGIDYDKEAYQRMYNRTFELLDELRKIFE